MNREAKMVNQAEPKATVSARVRSILYPPSSILIALLVSCRSAPPPPPAAPAVAMAQRAVEQAAKLSAQEQNWPAAVQAWQLAVERLSLLNDRASEATAIHNLAQAERELDQYDEGRKHLEQAAVLNQRLGRTNEWWRNQIALLQIDAQSRNAESLKARLEKLRALASSLHDDTTHGLFLNELALWQKSEGDLSQAEKTLAQAQDHFRAAHDSYGLAAISANRAELYEQQKNYPAAVTSWKDALARFGSLHDPPGITRSLAGEGRTLLWARQDLAVAEDLLRRAARNYRTLQKSEQAQAVLELLAQCMAAEGKKAEAP